MPRPWTWPTWRRRGATGRATRLRGAPRGGAGRVLGRESERPLSSRGAAQRTLQLVAAVAAAEREEHELAGGHEDEGGAAGAAARREKESLSAWETTAGLSQPRT